MATVTATSTKIKSGSYEADLTIKNSTSASLTGWTITVNISGTTTIDKIKNFTVSNPNSTSILLTPSSKDATLAAGKSITEKFQGTGTMPTSFTFNGSAPVPPSPPGPTPTPGGSVPPSPAAPVIPAGATVVYNIEGKNLTSITDLSALGCTYQYSYPAYSGFSTTNPNPKYVALTQNNGIEMNIYVGDKAFQSGNSTEPRNELRFHAAIADGRDYVYQWDQYLAVTPTFDFGWAQVFGSSGPAFILRWRSGAYEILQDQGTKAFLTFKDTTITPTTDTNQWVNWRFEFNGSSSSGYERLYRNGVLMCEASGVNNSIGTNAYLKLGIYGQQMVPSNNVTIYKDNIQCYYT